MEYDLDGDVALVSASSSGLGKASAKALAREGANVVLNGRDERRLETAVADVRSEATAEVVGHSADLTSADAVAELVKYTVDEFGGVDHLVTSSGGPPSGPFVETSDEAWYRTFDLLVMSVVRLVRAAVPYLREGGGSIVTITSLSVKEAIDSLALSNSVRMGVVGLEKTLSKELAPDVRANAVLPATHETPRVEELVTQGIERGAYESYEEGLADWSEGVPLDRIGTPEEFGETVAFLCSDRASYITGVALSVDGGKSASNV